MEQKRMLKGIENNAIGLLGDNLPSINPAKKPTHFAKNNSKTILKKNSILNNKIILTASIMFLLLAVNALAASTNISLNYVYNGTDWIPWLATTMRRFFVIYEAFRAM